MHLEFILVTQLTHSVALVQFTFHRLCGSQSASKRQISIHSVLNLAVGHVSFFSSL